MEITFDVEIDDELLARATEVSGITDINDLLRLAMEEFVRVEKAKYDRLNGNDPTGETG